MPKLRSISTGIWSDNWFEDLPPSEKLLFIYLLTNEKNNMLGIYEISIKKICFETGLEKDGIGSILDSFQEGKKVKYIGGFIFLNNFLRHQKYNPNMEKAAIDSYNNLPDKLKLNELNPLERNTKGFERLCNAFVKPIQTLGKEEEEKEEEKEKKKKTKKRKSESEGGEKEKTEKRELRKFFNLSKDLKEIVQKSKNINIPNQRLWDWCKSFKQLNTIEGVSIDRMEEAMEWYSGNYDTDYCPVIESGSSFRSKFTNLEDAPKRKKIKKRTKPSGRTGYSGKIDYGKPKKIQK